MISWFERHNKFSLFITIMIAVGIFYISSLTFERAGAGGLGIESIIYHIFIFFLFALFLLMALVQGKNKKFILLGVVGAILYAITDELHQFFVPGRNLSLGDVFLDSVGIAFAFVIYFISLVYRNQKR